MADILNVENISIYSLVFFMASGHMMEPAPPAG